MKVIIAGTEEITDFEELKYAIADSGFEIHEVVCGLCKGPDLMGKAWAEKRGIHVEEFPADWNDIDAPGAVVKKNSRGNYYNAKAGFDRNQKMAEYADALIALWDGESPGTRDMINRARREGLEVHVHEC